MKAILYRSYGSPDVLRVEEVEKPVPKEDEVLLSVRAASVNPADWHLMEGKPSFTRLLFGLGLARPKDTRFGRDVAGQVEAVGRGVTRFTVGDAVFGACRGALAEYACARELHLARKPDRLSFEESAAAVIAGLTALQGLRDKGRVQPGQSVLINGAAGGVGTFAVQIAKALGADVTAVCSARNVELVRSIGADRVIDYSGQDFTKKGHHYDVIFDLVGNHSLATFRRLLQPRGTYVGAGVGPGISIIGFMVRAAVAAPLLSRFATQRFSMFITRITSQDLGVLADLMNAGTVKPVIERRYTLSEVPEAIRYLATGHARAKLAVTVS